jgi:long-subunit fatty acid transport protein
MDGLHLRGGAFYETSAFGDETFSVAVLDGDKLGLTLGVSFDVGPVRVDVAAARIMQGTRVVETSEVSQMNATNPNQTTVVGNGTYESGFWTAGLGASWRFGG